MRPRARRILATTLATIGTIAPLAAGYLLYRSSQPPTAHSSSDVPSVTIFYGDEASTAVRVFGDTVVVDTLLPQEHEGLMLSASGDGLDPRTVTIGPMVDGATRRADDRETRAQTIDAFVPAGVQHVQYTFTSPKVHLRRTSAGVTTVLWPRVEYFDGFATGGQAAPTQGTVMNVETFLLFDGAVRREPAWPQPQCALSIASPDEACAPGVGLYRYFDDDAISAAATRQLWSGVLFGVGGNGVVAVGSWLLSLVRDGRRKRRDQPEPGGSPARPPRSKRRPRLQAG